MKIFYEGLFMKKNIVVNLIVCLFCLIHVIYFLIFKTESAEIIPIIQYISVIAITLFSIHINYKYDTEEKEFMQLFNIGIISKIFLYVLIIAVLMFMMCFNAKLEISIMDALGISIFNVLDVDNENVLDFMGEYNEIFHMPFLGFRYFHGTVGGQVCMAQTFLLVLVAYELFIKYRIKKVNEQDIFYKSDKK